MCLACESVDRERIWALIDVISSGQMPAGHTADDLRAMGLPLPGELYRETQADGTVLIRQRSPAEIAALNNKPFECDSPK